MKKNVRLYDSFPNALDALAKDLRGRKFAPDKYYIVLTPDRYTLKVEQALFSDSGAIDCEVLTLSRLSRRVLGEIKSLSREGSVILMRRAIGNVASDLHYYTRATRFTDFARQVYEAVQQAEASDVDLTAIDGGGAKEKLHDLALIKTEYDRLKNECLDSSDKLRALIAAAPTSELIRNSTFYAIGYSDATKLNYAVFDAIGKVCRGFEFFDVDVKPEEIIPTMQLYCAPDPVSEYKAVASRIRDYVIKGGRYEDVSVICAHTQIMSRIFREYGIDFYADVSAPLYELAPLKAIELAYKLHSGDCSTSVVTALCANPYSGCDSIDAEKLAFELASRGVSYCPKSRTIDDDGARSAMLRAYELSAYFDAPSFSDAVEALIVGGEFERRCDELKDKMRALTNDDDLVFTDAVTPIRNIAELIRVYGTATFDDDAACFFSAAQSVEIRSVPRYSDRVVIGSEQSFRMTECKILYVTDFNEGVLPTVTTDTGLLSDADIKAIGNVIEPTVREKNRRSRRELYAVMRNAENLTCMYTTSGGARLSAFCSALFDWKNRTEKRYTDEIAALKRSTSAPFIASLCCSSSAAGEAAERGLTAYSAELKTAAGEALSAPPFSPVINGVKHDRLSVSELNDWFACPYKRFLAYSVGVKERRREGFSAPDFGVVMHDFMKEFVDSGYDHSREFVEKTVDRILTDYKLEPTPRERDNIVRDALEYAETNKSIIEAGAYRPVGNYTERGFGGDILLGAAQIPFVGRIDRVDECEYDSNRVRIIDYKTQDKSFDMAKCRDGRDMQLAMYAAAVGKDKYVTGMFYVPLKSFFGSAKGKLRGCMVNDQSVIEDYDKNFFENGKSEVLPYTMYPSADGYKTIRKSDTLLEPDEFKALIDRCVKTASIAADEMDSGYIERTPADGACTYCAYKALCSDKKER